MKTKRCWTGAVRFVSTFASVVLAIGAQACARQQLGDDLGPFASAPDADAHVAQPNDLGPSADPDALVCDATHADCNADTADACETAIGDDPMNCGACGNVCAAAANASPACDAGSCALACSVGFDDCDGDDKNGCETGLTDDPMNCGACGHACGAGGTCSAGSCFYAYGLDDAPAWLDMPPTFSCLEACATVFGGAPSDWACSIDQKAVTHTAWVTGFGSDMYCPGNEPADETFKAGDRYDGPGAFSAYANDWCIGAINFCVAK